MPETRNVIDVEAFLVAALRADASLDALLANRIGGELPADFPADGEARVRLFRVGGAPDASDSASHLDRPSVQFDCYGSSREEAFDVAAAVERSVRALEGTKSGGVVVTRVRRNLGPVWSPDPVTNAPRYLLGAILAAHAA